MYKSNRMGQIQIKTNSIEGYNFRLGMNTLLNDWEKARKLFTKFTEENGFSAWHIHDGWVMSGYTSGQILDKEDITITWIESHVGYSHTLRCPDIGEKIIIVNDSPRGNESKPLNLYCYEVIDKKYFLGYTITLKKIELKQAVFNKEKNEYEFYTKRNKSLSRIFNECFSNLKI